MRHRSYTLVLLVGSLFLLLHEAAEAGRFRSRRGNSGENHSGFLNQDLVLRSEQNPTGTGESLGSSAAKESEQRGQRVDELELINAVRNIGGRSVEGQYDPRICVVTRQYAAYLASRGILTHNAQGGLRARANQIGAGNASEILATSYGHDIEKTLAEHAKSCVEGWYGSPGHRRAMMAYHQRYCYSMAQGANGRFYCVGIFAD